MNDYYFVQLGPCDGDVPGVEGRGGDAPGVFGLGSPGRGGVGGRLCGTVVLEGVTGLAGACPGVVGLRTEEPRGGLSGEEPVFEPGLRTATRGGVLGLGPLGEPGRGGGAP